MKKNPRKFSNFKNDPPKRYNFNFYCRNWI